MIQGRMVFRYDKLTNSVPSSGPADFRLQGEDRDGQGRDDQRGRLKQANSKARELSGTRCERVRTVSIPKNP